MRKKTNTLGFVVFFLGMTFFQFKLCEGSPIALFRGHPNFHDLASGSTPRLMPDNVPLFSLLKQFTNAAEGGSGRQGRWFGQGVQGHAGVPGHDKCRRRQRPV